MLSLQGDDDLPSLFEGWSWSSCRRSFTDLGARAREGSSGEWRDEKCGAGERECEANHPEEWSVKISRDEEISAMTLE